MEIKNFYSNAHLVVAAIKILEHQDGMPPSIDKVCEMLKFSLEMGNLVCKKLDETGIIEIVEGSYGTRLFNKDHLKLEEIPKNKKPTGLEDEIKKFQNSKKDFTKEIESFQAKQTEKRNSLFEELDKKLKENIEKRTTKKNW